MQQRFVVDASGFSRFNPGPRAPVWWGILGLILVEASVVAGFVASYFYLLLMAPQWPPPGVEPPPLLWPSITVLLLLASCLTMWWGSKAIINERYRQFVWAMFSSVGLACLVLVLRWQQFQAMTVRWDDHAYGSIVWTIMGFHFIHVVSAALGTSVVGILGIMRYFTPYRQIGVIVDTMYWNFVGLVWIPFYILLCWVPRWL
tara:strand:- start:9236 stop:9841 length:606 start_codon:yes stop_codon:yes gene_type:complete